MDTGPICRPSSGCDRHRTGSAGRCGHLRSMGPASPALPASLFADALFVADRLPRLDQHRREEQCGVDDGIRYRR
jgi:hypothetical protein